MGTSASDFSDYFAVILTCVVKFRIIVLCNIVIQVFIKLNVKYTEKNQVTADIPAVNLEHAGNIESNVEKI